MPASTRNRRPAPRAGRLTFVDVLMVLLLGLIGYGGYSLVTGFSFPLLLGWVVVWFAGFLFLGFMLPDWSNLEAVQKAYESLDPVLDQPGRKVYREELDRTLERIFQIRDRVQKARELLKQFPLTRLRREVEETAAELARATPGSESAHRLGTRLGDLQETLVRIEAQGQLATDFEDMKKTWVASMGHLRVRLETNPGTGPLSGGDEVLQELTSLHRITAAVEEGKPWAPPAMGNPVAMPDPILLSPEGEDLSVPPRRPTEREGR